VVHEITTEFKGLNVALIWF